MTQTDFTAAVERAKLAALVEFAYGAGHEINNPLANISARAQTLLRDETHPERRHKLAVIVAQAQRAHEMIADLMLFAKPPRLQREPLDITTWLPGVLTDLCQHAAERRQIIHIAVPNEPLELFADPAQLAVALRAIVTNALEAFAERPGTVTVTAERDHDVQDGNVHDAEAANAARVTIQDDGPGMDARAKEHCFDPFFSGREAGRGLGFGLCKAWRIITDHGGTVTVESEPGNGAKFEITLSESAECGVRSAE